jgi:hypothetical protein
LSLADIQIQVATWIQDTAKKLSSTDRDRAIAAAVETYSRHRPRVKIATLTGDGVAFDFAVPSDWMNGISSIISIENPVDEQVPEFLDESAYTVRLDPATSLYKIRFLAEVLDNGEKAYLAYGIGHVLTTAIDTIPPGDRLAVIKLAAAGCATQLAALYAQTSDPTFGADTVNYRTKSQDYLALAKALEAAYRAHVGAPTGVAAASVSGDLDVALQGTAGPPFFHDDLTR